MTPSTWKPEGRQTDFTQTRKGLPPRISEGGWKIVGNSFSPNFLKFSESMILSGVGQKETGFKKKKSANTYEALKASTMTRRIQRITQALLYSQVRKKSTKYS